MRDSIPENNALTEAIKITVQQMFVGVRRTLAAVRTSLERRLSGRITLTVVIVLGAAALAALLAVSRIAKAQATTITVNTLEDESTPDDGLCSLREALGNINASGQPNKDCESGATIDTIDFAVSGTIKLTQAVLGLQKNATINGAGVTLDGNGGPILAISGGLIYLEDLTLPMAKQLSAEPSPLAGAGCI